MKTFSISAALVTVASSLCAQPTEDPAKLSPVVVTASRVPMDADRVIASATVLDRAYIEARQVVHVADLLRDVPGVAVSRSGAVGSQAQVRVRGAEANHVLVMIDGVEANDPASGDEFRFESLLADDVERIEIIRGPQSALWGTDALAGVINIITRKGESPGRGSVALEAGSDDTLHGDANVAFGSGHISGRIGVSHFETDGSNISRQGSEADGAEIDSLNANLTAQMSDRSSLTASLRYEDTSADLDGVDFVNTGLPVDADLGYENQRLYARLGGHLDSESGLVGQSLNLTWLDTENDNLAGAAMTSSTASEKIGLRYQVDFQLSDAHRITTALDYEDVDFRQRGAASPFGDPNQDQSIDTLGLVVEYVGQLEGGWDVSASVRGEDHSDFDDVVTWQGGLGYAISDASRLRISAGSGRKAPTFIERFGFFPDVFIGNPDLKPEKSRSVEIGYDWRWASGNVSVTWFDQDLDNEINGFIFDPATGSFTAGNEDGASDRQGVELAGQWDLSAAWSLNGSYTYTDATEQSFRGEVDELRRPRHMAHLGLGFDGGGGFTGHLNVSYNGRRDDIFFPPFPEPSQTVELQDYLLIHLAGRYRVTRDLDLIGRIENLTDEDYEDVFGFATPGRTIMAGVRWRFGQ